MIKYHQHDSLLEHRPEEQLSKDEIEKAWQEFDNEKKGIFTHMYDRPQVNQYNQFGNQFDLGNFNNLMDWRSMSSTTQPTTGNRVFTKQNWLHTIQVIKKQQKASWKSNFRKKLWNRLSMLARKYSMTSEHS